MRVNPRNAALLVIAAALVGLGARAITNGVGASHASTSALTVVPSKGSRAPAQACGQNPAVLGTVGIVRPSAAPSDLAAAGMTVRATLTESSQAVGTHRDTFVVLGSASSAANSLLSAHGVVLAQNADRSLLSCDYHLADSPAAQPYIAAAKAAAEGAGLASATELNSDASLYLLSDDPTRAGRLLVTLDIPGPVVPGPANAPTLHSLRSIFALIWKSTDSVTAVGEGTW